MNNIQFHLLDLNLLRVFNAIFEERSVMRAATKLNVTPSAISHSLGRLRLMLADDLFVRDMSGMQPTPRAFDVGPRVRNALLDLERALEPSSFSPATCTRSFTISATPYLCWVLLPHIVRLFREQAPKAEIRTIGRSTQLIDDIDSGRIDVALGLFQNVPRRWVRKVLLTDNWVWVMRADHPLASDALTIERLAAASHVLVSYGRNALRAAPGDVFPISRVEPDIWGANHGTMYEAIAEKGLPRPVSINVPDSISALAIVSESDMIAPVPRRLVGIRGGDRLHMSTPPYPATPVEFNMLWHRTKGDDPALIWLRGLIMTAVAGIDPAE